MRVAISIEKDVVSTTAIRVIANINIAIIIITLIMIKRKGMGDANL